MTIVLSEDYVNLNIRAAVAGRDHCTGACETRQGCNCHAAQCPPCNHRCAQGRACNAQAASASSELLADDENAEARFRCQRARALFWQFYLVVVLASIGAAIPYVLPLLRAWMKN